MKNKVGLCLALISLPLSAGPVTTVPWNGHTGAVSFTYDDARSSQIPNLLPQLDALRIKATFFIAVTGTGGDFTAKIAQWTQAARNGHELANHTYNHVNVPADPNAASIILQMAQYLRALDPVVQSVTFAYPNCNVNGKVGVGSEDFIARGCGQTSYSWATQPADWMNIQGLILTPTNVSTAVTFINSARTGNTWVSTIVHDVTANPPDQYSITPADNQRMLDAAVSDGLWIDTYQNIAAYYRAHFPLDATNATTTPSGWTLVWASPHPKMPKSVNLRVRLATATFGTNFTVQQGGITIAPETDGSYVIDFMKLQMTVTPNSTGISPARWFKAARIRVRASGRMLNIHGAPSGTYDLALHDVSGSLVERKIVRVTNASEEQAVSLRSPLPRGIYQLTLKESTAGITRNLSLFAFQ